MMAEEEFVQKALREQGYYPDHGVDHVSFSNWPERYWMDQYRMFEAGVRDARIHDLTFLLLLP